MSFLRRKFYFVADFLRTMALFLGIAAMATLAVGVLVPAVQGQSYEFHRLLLDSWRPAANPDYQLAVSRTSLTAAEPSPFIASLENSDTVLGPGLTTAQGQALRAYIARKYRIAENVAASLINTVFEVGAEKDLDPQLLLAIIAIESRYNPFAESHVGAQGLMQVMTSVHKEKFDEFAGKQYAAIDPDANIRVGAQILSDCLQRRGSIRGGLACYVGAVGPSDGGYGARVIAEWRRLALESGIPISD